MKPSAVSCWASTRQRTRRTLTGDPCRTRSACRPFVLQGVDHGPGLRADDPVDRKARSLLEIPHRRFGLRAEAPVDASGIEADGAHPALKTAHRETGRSEPENRLALVGFVDVDPRHPTDDAVGRDLPLRLESTPS